MSFRNRPVLKRKRRPRWQEELRTQQLVVSGFAIAIAIAIGIFAATEWAGYWESHLAPVATVADHTFDRADVTAREQAISADLIATANELSDQLGGPNDQFLQQQISSIETQLADLSDDAAASLVQGRLLTEQSAQYGVELSEEDLDAAIAERTTLPPRRNLQLITFDALPEDAEEDAEPTEEQTAAAREEADAALGRVEGGEDFGAVAAELSDDFTASLNGSLGWVQDDDPSYDAYFDATADSEANDIVGPIETDRGWGIVKVVDVREQRENETLSDLLAQLGAEAAFREYVRDQELRDAFEAHFADEVVTSPAPQQEVAQIVIAPLEGEPAPQRRARHILVMPDPELQDQSTATEEQWAAALAEAELVHELVSEPEADWFALAEEHSDDTGSGARGGDLGWSNVDASPYVPEFTAALEELDLMEISEQVRTTFGYHVIQLTGLRDSPAEQAEELVAELRDDPDSFAEVASVQSEDGETAREGGELGWVARYQLGADAEAAIFALTDVGEISDPVELEDGSIVIYKLLETSDSREIEDDRLEQIRSDGFSRWLTDEVESQVTVWVDTDYVSTDTTAA